MTKSFDEWYFKQRYLGIEPIDHARAAFKAGAQSKQAEIDELRKRINEALEYSYKSHNYNSMTGEVSEIVDILKWKTNEQ